LLLHYFAGAKGDHSLYGIAVTVEALGVVDRFATLSEAGRAWPGNHQTRVVRLDPARDVPERWGAMPIGYLGCGASAGAQDASDAPPSAVALGRAVVVVEYLSPQCLAGSCGHILETTLKRSETLVLADRWQKTMPESET